MALDLLGGEKRREKGLWDGRNTIKSIHRSPVAGGGRAVTRTSKAPILQVAKGSRGTR